MELTAEQKESLKPVLKEHFHYQITPEIRRELFSTANRGEMDIVWSVCLREERMIGI